jgi:hypothetical protein
MSLALIIIFLKLTIYPICALMVYRIGRVTGFWKGWVWITFGMANPVLTVILQLVDYSMDIQWLSEVAALWALLSILFLGIGFYYVLQEVQNGKH